MSHHDQMSWMAAQTVVAQVINLFFAGDITKVIGVHDQVNSNCLPVQGHSTVPTTSSYTRIGSSPDMAGAWFLVQHESEVSYLNSFLDALEYVFPPIN
jgi:hypothetical protein